MTALEELREAREQYAAMDLAVVVHPDDSSWEVHRRIAYKRWLDAVARFRKESR